MFVSIIIPTYNRAHSIVYTLDSFLKQDYPVDQYEIIVCDNNSTDNVKEIILDYMARYGEDRIKYLFEGRQGVHYARNTAAKTAKGDILYFTDDDMLAEPDLLKQLIPVFTINSRVGCATGKVLPKWETEPPRWIKKYFTNSTLSLNDKGKRTFIRDYDVGVYSCHEAIRRETFFETGGFHPEYTKDIYLGDGETGLNRDIVRNGWMTAYVGKSIIYHMIPQKRMTQRHINKFYRNYGFATSYSAYREKAFVKSDLPSRYKEYFKSFLRECKYDIKGALYGKTTLRSIPAKMCFYRARVIYDYQIVSNERFRRLVMKNDWLR
ncbi:MAG: glycosyltransferase family 2 protein [Lachnospiraceae bacterium]|nr:glycosyltransferase family 2 protein [Lachnospiraceae bacterium]